MANAIFDVVGVGNAIVDVIAQASEAQIARLGLAKGTMTLIDAAAAERLYAEMGAGIESSGGSAANTIAGIASFGGKAAYIGKVRDDKLGRAFRHDIRAVGVEYRETPRDSGPPTARCLIFVTPDAQRTMQTFLGISVELGPGDIDQDLIGAAQITYLEGYLFDREAAKEAFVRAAEVAHAAGRRVALTLSDPFCVERHRAAFQHLVAGHVDILFANELEIASLYQTRSFEDAVAAVRGNCEIAALTRGAKGSVIVAPSGTHQIAAEPVARVVDTTGAGDLYAAGVLYGLTRGYEPAVCGRYGSLAAAEVIGHFGARPEMSLAALARKKVG
jgi:sugar/nucleoside kinase (ribokinase family)